MNLELTHDIIAEKIWERLPESDRMFRQALESLEFRYKNFIENKGGLLEEKALLAFEPFYKQFRFELRQYLHQSRQKIEQDKEAKRRQIYKEQQLNNAKLVAERKARELSEQSLAKEKRWRQRQQVFIVLLISAVVSLLLLSLTIYNQYSKSQSQTETIREQKESAVKKQEKFDSFRVAYSAVIQAMSEIDTLFYQTLKSNYDEKIKETREKIFNPIEAEQILEEIINNVYKYERVQLERTLLENEELTPAYPTIDEGASEAKELLNDIVKFGIDCAKQLEVAADYRKKGNFYMAIQEYQLAKNQCSNDYAPKIDGFIEQTIQTGKRYFLSEGDFYKNKIKTETAYKTAKEYYQKAAQLFQLIRKKDEQVENRLNEIDNLINK